MYGRWSSMLCSASSTDGDMVVKRFADDAVLARSSDSSFVSRGSGDEERGVRYPVSSGRAMVVRWW